MKKKILITGGAGFIGSNFSKYLLKKNFTINILDNLSTGSLKNLPKGINFFKGDIRNPRNLVNSLDGCLAVFHLAAKSSLQETVSKPKECISNNILGTSNIINLCIKKKIKLIFASTCAVYPLKSKKKLKEIDHGNYETPYAISKICCENLINFYVSQKKIKANILRFFNVYGSGQNPTSEYSAVIPKFIKQSKSNLDLTIYNTGKQKRDFINVKDVCVALFKAYNYRKSETFNIATGKTTSINDLAKMIIKQSNSRGKIKKHKNSDFDAFFSCADVYKSRSKLRFNAKINIETGIKELINNEI